MTTLESRLSEALSEAVKWVIAERDSLYASVSTASGAIPEPGDREDVAAYDTAIDGWAGLLADAGLPEWTATRRAMETGLRGGNA